MGDAYWSYSDTRPQPPMSSYGGKRPRSEYDVHSGHDLSSYYSRDDDGGALHVVRDTETIGASYDRYLHSAQGSSYGGQSARPISGKMSSHPIDDLHLMSMGSVDRGALVKEQTMGFGGGRPENPLPPDASSTLYVEGLPPNCSRREVAHIFRPFVGYKEVRIVSKESKLPGGDPLVLCFVDFQSPAHAATAMDALQGYKFDEHDRYSVNLRLQFARYAGARSGGGGGYRGKR